MIWENTKLLLGLLYRPVASMGRIVDEGHWLYAAVVVAALSMVFHASVTSVLYNNYEAVYRDIPQSEEQFAGEAEYEDEEEAAPTFYYDKLPLPLVGQHGWWFVSFAQPSFFTAVLRVAIFYIPGFLLLVGMAGANANFRV